jgi:hypothetical protein
MTAAILFEVEGKPTPSSDCSWLLYAPCGCMCGVHVAGYGDTVIASADEAWKSIEVNAEQRRRDKAAGFTVVLGLRSECMKLQDDCPHTPRYGVVKTPVPDGHEWAQISGGGRRSSRRKHLVPTIGVENCKEGRYGSGDTAALCGESGWSWRTEWYALDAPECLACVKKAKATPPALTPTP